MKTFFAQAFMCRTVLFLCVSVSASGLSALEFKVERDIPYRSAESMAKEGEYARSRCLLDMRVPVGVTNFATVIHFHGGGIVKGNKGSFSWPDEAYKDDPIAQVSGGYRLLTNATPEQAVSDAAAAVALKQMGIRSMENALWQCAARQKHWHIAANVRNFRAVY